MRAIDLAACDAETGRRYLFQRVLALHWGLGRTEEADAMLVAARGLHELESWRQQVDGLRGEILAFDGPIAEAVALTEPLVRDPRSDAWARFYGVNAVVTQLGFSGATDDAIEVLEPYTALAA